jgi:hypothetical protein
VHVNFSGTYQIIGSDACVTSLTPTQEKKIADLPDDVYIEVNHLGASSYKTKPGYESASIAVVNISGRTFDNMLDRLIRRIKENYDDIMCNSPTTKR